MENLPWHISVTFIVTTFLTVGFFLFAIRQTVFETTSAKIFSFASRLLDDISSRLRNRRFLFENRFRSAAAFVIRSFSGISHDYFVFCFCSQKFYRKTSVQNFNDSSHHQNSRRSGFVLAFRTKNDSATDDF